MQTQKRGIFIVFEGACSSKKDEQVELLKEYHPECIQSYESLTFEGL